MAGSLYQSLGDRAAILLSTCCTVHCLALPFALVAFPALGATLIGDEAFHGLLLWMLLPASVIALLLGCRQHKDRFVIALGALGLVVLMATGIWGHDLLGEMGERIATTLGSVVLVSGHLRNYRLCRQDKCEE